MNELTKEQKIQLIERCVDINEQMHVLVDKLQDYLGVSPDGAVCDVLFTIYDEYIRQVNARLGDRYNQLEWYIYEILGSPTPVPEGDDLRKVYVDSEDTPRYIINTVGDLIDFIEFINAPDDDEEEEEEEKK